MNTMIKKNNHQLKSVQGFVLPFTLLICGIMLLISVSISTILTKQIYFSNIARGSQIAYFAADNALACVLSIEETYSDGVGGFFPYDSSLLTTTENLIDMSNKLDNINLTRVANGFIPLASTIDNIRCAQSEIFNTSALVSDFRADTTFSRDIDGGGTEEGKTSNFLMKMKIADNDYRCARITLNKTASYKQIISQGYSRCDRPNGSIERAVVYITVQ